MTAVLENDIREALATQAASLDLADALSRVRAVDYRPRRSTLARRLSLGVAAGSAAGGTVLAVVLVGSAQPAFAGWTAAPTASTVAQSAVAGESCQSALANSPVGQEAGGGTWQPVVTDIRGPFTLSTEENSGVYATCFTGPDFTMVNASSPTAGSMSVSVSQGAGAPGGRAATEISALSGGDIERLTVAHLSSSTDGAYTLVGGQVSSAVTGVTLVETDGTQVVATVANGWVLAWWPGDGGIGSAAVTTASGTSTQPLTQMAPPVGGPGSPSSCVGGSAPSEPTSCASSETAG